MGCKNANHAHDSSTPASTHHIQQKKAHGQVFGLDLHHIEADQLTSIHLGPGVCESYDKALRKRLSVISVALQNPRDSKFLRTSSKHHGRHVPVRSDLHIVSSNSSHKSYHRMKMKLEETIV